MQEPHKKSESPKTRNGLEMPPGPQPLRVILERGNTSETAENRDISPTQDTSDSDALHARDTSQKSDEQVNSESIDTTASQDESREMQDLIHSSHLARPSDPSVSESLKKPLLAIAAVAALLGAAWNYTALEDARAQLTVVSEAKASVERALAEAQGKLSAAEKAVADVKAALTTGPAAASAKKSAAAPEPAAAVPAKQ